MAVTDVREIGFGKRRARFTDQYTQEYTRSFRIYLDAATSDFAEEDLAAAEVLGLPARWDAHPSDALCLVSDITVSETDDPQKWIADVTYTSTGTDQSRVSQNPLDEPPAVTWQTETYRQAVEFDANGSAILNSAYDQIEGVETERYRLVLTYEDNVAWFDWAEAMDHLGTVNEEEFLGGDVETWLIRDYTQTGRGFKNGVAYFRRKIVFVFDPFKIDNGDGTFTTVGWALRLLDAGYRKYVGVFAGADVWVPHMDYGRPVSQPVPMDGNGNRLAAGAAPHYLTFHPFVMKDFNTSITGFSTNF